MPSTFAWLDDSEREPRRALDVISLFRVQETRDELALASIRDAFAERYFPGASTIQMRARYVRFVPAICRGMAERGVSSAEAVRRHRAVVRELFFAEMLEQSLSRCQNRSIETAEMIEELIEVAQEMHAATARGEATLCLTEDELAFYDVLGANDSAVQVLGAETLRAIAKGLVATVSENVTVDWTLRDNVRAQVRVLVKRFLRKHGYPPDKQGKATQTVREQAELCERWAA